MKITLLWNPYSTNNIYTRNWRRWFIKSKPKALKESYKIQAKSQVKQMIQGDIVAYIDLYFWDKRKRDVDNFHKLSLDALTGIAYEDDSQIQKMNICKFYDKDNPRIEVVLEEV